jgi:hypothetical protein
MTVPHSDALVFFEPPAISPSSSPADAKKKRPRRKVASHNQSLSQLTSTPVFASAWDGSATTRRRRSTLMPDVLCCCGVNGIFGDVGGVVTDAFKTARN